MPCLAQTPIQDEYERKAALLHKIILYVDWPSDASSNQPASIQIGLLGQIPFPEAFDVLNGKRIQGRKLAVKRISNQQEALDCQVLFIGASEKSRLTEIIAELKNRPILTVSEVEGFAEQGGMVNLLAQVGSNNKLDIAMEINREVAGRARLSFSSNLLRYAAKIFSK